MKRASILSLFTLAAVLAVAVTGCKNPDRGITPITKSGQTPRNPGAGGPLDGVKTTPDEPVRSADGGLVGAVGGPGLIENMIPDPAFFKADTIYFAYDSAAVKTSERGRLENVAGYLKGNREHKVQVAGHCDERGTAEYNRALGERRALAAREYLVRLGIDADRVFTISYGKDVPAVPGTDDASRTKNRRDEFILLKPKN